MAIGKMGYAGIGVVALILIGGSVLVFAQPFNTPDPHQYDSSEITGYHYHTYFYQQSTEDFESAETFRAQIQREIILGNLVGCSVGRAWDRPIGPHIIGQYVTCCKATGISRATSWFMKNRRHHSVLLHPLTKQQLLDHSERVMWLGAPLPLDLNRLAPVLEENPHC